MGRNIAGGARWIAVLGMIVVYRRLARPRLAEHCTLGQLVHMRPGRVMKEAFSSSCLAVTVQRWVSVINGVTAPDAYQD